MCNGLFNKHNYYHILYNISLLFSHTVHLSTAGPFSTPPYSFPTSSFCSASPLPVSPQKRAGLPGRSQQNTRSTTTLTLWDKPKEEKSPQSKQSVRITHTLIVRSNPPKTKPTTYQICGGPVTNPCRISVSLHEHCWADASSVLSWCLQPLCIPFLLLVPGIPWSLSVGTGWKPPNWVFSFFCRSLHLLPSASSGSLVDHHWTTQL